MRTQKSKKRKRWYQEKKYLNKSVSH
jgi:hypothetical protein